MARVTIEDCVRRYPNRFEMTLLAAKRARQLMQGLPPLIEVEPGEKPIVTALREIGAGRLDWDTYHQLEARRRQQQLAAETTLGDGAAHGTA